MKYNPRFIKTSDPKAWQIGDSQDYMLLVARRSCLMMRSFFPLGYSSNALYRKFFGFSTLHQPFYAADRGVYANRDAMAYDRQEILKKCEKDKDYLQKSSDKCQEVGENLLAFSRKVRKANLSSKSDAEIRKLAESAIIQMIELSAFLLFPISMQSYFEEKIRARVKESVSNPELQEKCFNALTTPTKENLTFFEQKMMLELASGYSKQGKMTPNLSKKISKYTEEFESLGTKYGAGELWSESEVIIRMKYLSGKNPAEKLKHIIALSKENKKKAEEALKLVKADAAFRELVRLAREYVYFRTYRTDALNVSFANCFPLWKEIARRTGRAFDDVRECLPNEVSSMKMPPHDMIEERKKSILLRGVDGNLYYTYGAEAERISNLIKEKVGLYKQAQKHTGNEIRGSPAFKGKVRGTVKILLDNSMLGKMNEGDILVASMTTPDYVPAMEKAAAFVTDEGGILCHAAIVSREMKKPCVIGTKIATKVLKDGDFVEVDAKAGTVKILERK